MTTYDLYCAWCRDHNRTPPTREWWDNACAKRTVKVVEFEPDFDITTEQREGWGYQ